MNAIMTAVLTGAALLVLLAIASDLDLREADDQAVIYQTMVCEGTWPDYKNLSPRCEP